MTGAELEMVIESARDFVTNEGLDSLSSESFEGRRIAEALVQLAGTCVIGVACERHGGAVHGREAEELRAGVERITRQDFDAEDLRDDLRRMLDDVDARDSLAFLEATDGLDEARP